MSPRAKTLLTGLAIVMALFAVRANAQVVPTNIWNPNYASGTITPRPSTLQIPCANIVGGCNASSGAVTSFNGATGTVTYAINAGAGLSVTTSTTSSTLTVNLNNGSVQNCSNQGITGLSATGTITCSAVVFSIGGVSTGTITISGTSNEITIATTTNSITLSTPQAIGTGSSPTFAGATINGTITDNGETVTGNVTSTSAHIGSNIIGAAGASSSFAGEVNFGASAPNLVIASTTFTELGAYMNGLCNQNVSGTLIFVPAMLPASSTFTTQLQETQRCTYEGVGGGGTTWTWGGASTTAPINIDVSALPHTVGGGIQDISLVNGNSTTTNSVGISLSGGSVNTSGGAHILIQLDTFVGWYKAIDIASGTYAVAINDNSFHANNYCVYAEPASNSGESVEGSQNWCVDPVGGTGGFYFATSSVENAYFDQLTIDNTTLQADGGDTVSVGTLETENSGGASGPYIPVIAANDPTTNIHIGFWQLHNDGNQTSTTYAAAVQVDGNVEIDNMSVGKNATASSTPFLVTSVSGAAGSENLTLCNVVNQSNSGPGYTKLVGGAANNAFPTSTFNGCMHLIKGNYIYSMLETTNDNTVQYWNGNGLVMENVIPSGGSAGTSQTCIGGGCTEGSASGTLEILSTVSSTLQIGKPSGSACLKLTDMGNTANTDWVYASSTAWVLTQTKPSFCQ